MDHINKIPNFFIVLLAVDIVLSLYMLNYLRSLIIDNCDCSINWQRSFIMTLLALSVIWNLFLILISVISPTQLNSIIKSNKQLFTILAVGGLFVTFLQAIVTLDYIYNIRKCECSNKSGKQVMMIVSIINIIVFVLCMIRFTSFSSVLFHYLH